MSDPYLDAPDDHLAVWASETATSRSERDWERWADQAERYAEATCEKRTGRSDALDNGGLGDPDGDGCSLDGAYDLWEAGRTPQAAVDLMRADRVQFDQLSQVVAANLGHPLAPQHFQTLGASGLTLTKPMIAGYGDMFMFVARVTPPSGRPVDLAFAGAVSANLGADSKCHYWVTHDFTPTGVPRNWVCTAGSPSAERATFLTEHWRRTEGYDAAFSHGIHDWARNGAPASNLPARLSSYQTTVLDKLADLHAHMADTPQSLLQPVYGPVYGASTGTRGASGDVPAAIAAQATPNAGVTTTHPPAPPAPPAVQAVAVKHL